MRVKQLQLFEKTEKYRFIIRHHQHIGQDIFRQLRTIIHLCTIILQSIIIGGVGWSSWWCVGKKQIERKGYLMSQSALPKLGVISTGAFFVVDLIGVILVSIVTAYILYRYFFKRGQIT